jgi:hypothetical protein
VLPKKQSTLPPMRSVTAAPAPLYGTCVILMPARRWKSSPPMWPMVPFDDEAMLTLPGFLLRRVHEVLERLVRRAR